MRKIFTPVIFILFVAFFGSLFAQSSFAYSRPQVLGLATTQIELPPTSEGPGYILPDSPFYFLDLIKQQVRIFFAFTPLQKAQVYNSIAGERIAELRFELAKGNLDASLTALQGLRDNTRNSAKEMEQAKFGGNNVQSIAQELNRSIAEHQKILDIAEKETTGELKAEVGVAQTALSDAKGVAEEGLPADELANAVQDDLVRDASRFATNTTDAATQLKISLDLLQQQATIAAKENLAAREAALQKAIEEKNKALQAVEQTNLNQEKEKTSLSESLQAQAAAEAQEVINRASTVANTVQSSLQVMQGITPTPSLKK
ncbi:MAG TPA: DUF5667 domain-containing protein [Patescibacteria group bacterium]